MNRKLVRNLLLLASGGGLCLLVLFVSQRQGNAPQSALEGTWISERVANSSTALDPGGPRTSKRTEALGGELDSGRPLEEDSKPESPEDSPQTLPNSFFSIDTVDEATLSRATNPDGRSLTKARKKELSQLLRGLRAEHSKLRVQLLDPTQATVRRKLEEGDYHLHVDNVPPHGPGGARRLFTHDKNGNPAFVDILPGDDPKLDEIRMELEIFTDNAVSQIQSLFENE